MALEKFEKQSWEEFFVAGDCVDVLETGEAVQLLGSSVVAEDMEGTDVSTTVLEQATLQLADSPDGGTDNMLSIRCRAGEEAKSPYKLTFKMNTNLSNQWEVDVRMKVKEK